MRVRHIVARGIAELCVYGGVIDILSAIPALLVSLKRPKKGGGPVNLVASPSKSCVWGRCTIQINCQNACAPVGINLQHGLQHATAVALQAGPFTVAPSAEEVPDLDETEAKTSAAPTNYRSGYCIDGAGRTAAFMSMHSKSGPKLNPKEPEN